ncbi:MAG: sugar transferase, partial [Clostridia bacterium]|nr:sugar transferase [Clostridia bacterium]
MYNNFIKRLFDIILSFMGIIILAIPMLIVALIIKIDDPGPAIFKQKRVGKDKE